MNENEYKEIDNMNSVPKSVQIDFVWLRMNVWFKNRGKRPFSGSTTSIVWEIKSLSIWVL